MSTVIVSYLWKTEWGQIVNYLTVGVVTAGGRGCGVPLPSRLGSLGEHRKLPQRRPEQSPGRKTSFGVFRAWKNTPDFTSPDFFHFPWPLRNFLTFPGFPGEWSPWWFRRTVKHHHNRSRLLKIVTKTGTDNADVDILLRFCQQNSTCY